jgi:3-oxoacyl-[acyl-carrier protein] reductase
LSKVALITGATGGIGRAIAKKLAIQGYCLQLHYNVNQKKAMELQLELEDVYGVKVQVIQADLGQSEGVQKLTSELNQSPDILIHNAGIAHYSLFTDITAATYQEMIQLHLTSPFALTQLILPQMISKKWGRIVFVTSIWGETGASCESLYSMVKGGLIALTKSLSKELAPSGITVNAVSPGAIDTQMMSDFDEDDLQRLYEEIPIGRMGSPEEVAHTIHFLLEQESGYMTGQVLRVNGGWYV